MPELTLPPLLRLEALTKHYTVRRGPLETATVKAVDGVDLQIMPGQSYGIVGESGSGKSTIAKLVLRLTAPTSGRVLFDGHRKSVVEGKSVSVSVDSGGRRFLQKKNR